ncbi:MAG: hypothetical protein WCB27_19785 [Thermoguttaceae bacterium]
MRKPLDKPAPRASGSIHADEVLSMAEFGRRLGFADKALSDAQKAGLRTIVVGRCKFILGSDALDWFRRLAEQQAGDGDGQGGES